MANAFETYESNVRSYCRSFPTVFTSAKGAVLTDGNGKTYIDFFSGAGGVNYGHNHPYIKEQVMEYLQSDGIIHALDMYTPAKEAFISYFQSNILEPKGFEYKIQFTGPTGTNAVEAALKLARKVTGRTNIFALMGAFHGMTMGSLALTTDASSRGGAGMPLSGVTHIPAPYMYPEMDTVDYMETLITDDHSGVEKPAAVVLEAVQADGGIYPMPVEYLQKLRAMCDRHNVLLIVDDIQAGCGRSGNFFAFERAGIVPDMVTLSKSIGGMGMPMALLLMKPELDIWSPGEHTGTFRGNQLSLVAAKAGLEVFVKENIAQQVAQKEALVADFMKHEIETINPAITTRGIGLLWGVDLSALGGDALSKAVMTRCFEKGLVLERVGRDNAVMKLMPTLTVEPELLTKGLTILRDSIQEVLKEA
ncbi:MAG: aspartate aminotransferase family protein [Clostridia bacterium]|nr:aspartate aminotransferase family protein [Clostridia bacterium]